ncbi:MAG: right-handed parallel beta-helix repeat-containing protein [Rhizobiales bacterium]|nr:right-handed parallel beta-helix repeat-containing protein [Hyphomicrobiales bacterium]
MSCVRRHIVARLIFPLLLSASLLLTAQPSRAGDHSRCPADAIGIAPEQSLQAAVDAASAGASFCLENGTHRMQAVRPKNGQRFYGDAHAVLNGSRLITRFIRDGAYWRADGQEARSRRQGHCMKSFATCNFPETLFIDDQPLTRVLQKDEIAPGRFFFDQPAAKIYVADDPNGRRVELATAAFAFAGNASDVRISNVVIEKFASPAQRGAVDAQNGKRWIVEDCEVRWNSGAGISVGEGSVVQDCDIHHNGQIGVTGAGNRIRIERNRISANNTRGFSMGWEAGGAKISLADGVTFRGNHVRDNRGPGLWCDGDCRNVVYEDNAVERNDEAGIYHEISFNAVIRNNVLRHNGAGSDGWFWGNDIIIAASEGVEVYDNSVTVSDGRCAIMLIDQARRDNGRLYQTRNNSVHDNDFLFEGAPCAGGVSDVKAGEENAAIITEGNNRFDRNTYRVARGEASYRFVWGHDEGLDWNALRLRGLEPNGRLVLH